jgi:hypothetical protein
MTWNRPQNIWRVFFDLDFITPFPSRVKGASAGTHGVRTHKKKEFPAFFPVGKPIQ